MIRGIGTVSHARALPAAPVDAVAATNTLTSNNTNVTAGDTVTLNGKVYTYVATVATEGDVLRGADADASLTNLSRAINKSGGTPGTDYQVALANPNASSSSVSSHALTFTALVKGTSGNALTLAKSAATLTVGGALFTGGIDGMPGAANEFGAYGTDVFYCNADSTVASAGTWKKVTLGVL